MKTPHTIKLIKKSEKPVFDPIIGDYVGGYADALEVPCLANYISQQRVFEMYGDRVSRVLIARFNQAQEPFDLAEYDGRTFKPIETLDAPIKGAVRLKEVPDG